MQKTDFAKKFPGKLVSTVHGSLAFLPNLLPPTFSWDYRLTKSCEQALLALGELRAILPTLPNPRLISEPYLRREAVSSSKIEGTNTELEGLYLFETSEPKEATANDTEKVKDAREVWNYVVALKSAIQQLDTLPICCRLLKQTHELLLANLDPERGRNKFPGKFRKVQVYIGSSDILSARFVAPPAENVSGLMTDLERYINAESNFPTLVNIAIVHYQFETIHPFADGNGRLGRLLIALMLIAQKLLPGPLLYLSSYFERHRDDYVKHLWQVSSKGAWIPWFEFFLEGIRHEAVDAAQRARKILALREDYRSRLQKSNASPAMFILVDELFSWPVTTVKNAEVKLGMTYQGAANNVAKLEKYGMLHEETGNYRNRVWVAREIMKLLSS